MTSFVDVTEFMDQAAEDLESGEFLLMPQFTLFDSMSAIEIMDPRMDSALVPPGFAPPEVPFTDPNAPLLAEEVCWVLDRTVSAEMGWHSGYALSQTVYTSLYMHEITPPSRVEFIPRHFPLWGADPARPTALVELVLQTGLMGIVKTCDMVWRELNKGYVYDLEDFNADKAEVSLFEGTQVPIVIRQLDKALVWLERWQTQDEQWRKALYDRIALRKHILLAVSTFEGPARRSAHILDALAAYHSVRAGPVPATPLPSSQLHAAFDPTINRRLIVSMPLKVIELMPIENAWKSLQSMLEGMLGACRTIESPNILDIMMSLRLRARLPSGPNRSAYIRSLNTTLLLGKFAPTTSRIPTQKGKDYSPVHQFMFQLCGLSLDRIRALKYWPGGRLPVDVDDLEQRIDRCMMQHLMALCYNRPRMRRKISKTLILWHEIWEDTVNIALEVRHDTKLADIKRLPLGIRHVRLANLVDWVFAGFETDLYTQSEWPLMYWHVTWVLGLQIRTVETLLKLLEEDPSSLPSSQTHARSYVTYYKALRSMGHGTLLTLFIKPPKYLNISDLSRQPTPDEYLLLQRRFKWAFGSHAKPTQYKDDARPDLEAWMQFAASVGLREPGEVMKDALKEFKEGRVHSLNLLDQSVWKTTTTASGQLMNEFLASCVKVCNAQISALESVSNSDDPEAGIEELNSWGVEHSSWFPTISRLISSK